MKIIIWIRWLPIIFRLWYIYECLLSSWHTSVDFTFGVFFLLFFMAQWTFAFSGSEMEALVWGVGYGRSWWWRHHSDVNAVGLVSLLFALDMLRAVSVFGSGHVGVLRHYLLKIHIFTLFIVVLVWVNIES